MIIKYSNHSLDRAMQYIKKVNTKKQAKKYLEKVFKRLCSEETWNGYPIQVYHSSKDAMSISGQFHTITFQKTGNNEVYIITYYYFTSAQRKGYKGLQSKEKMTNKIKQIQRRKSIYNDMPPE